MKTRITFGTMAAMATLAIGLLGAGVAEAGTACHSACKAQKGTVMGICRVVASSCNAVKRSCKQACREQFFGDDRKDCVEECNSNQKACKQSAATCKSDCIDAYNDCRTECVRNGL